MILQTPFDHLFHSLASGQSEALRAIRLRLAYV